MKHVIDKVKVPSPNPGPPLLPSLARGHHYCKCAFYPENKFNTFISSLGFPVCIFKTFYCDITQRKVM